MVRIIGELFKGRQNKKHKNPDKKKYFDLLPHVPLSELTLLSSTPLLFPPFPSEESSVEFGSVEVKSEDEQIPSWVCCGDVLLSSSPELSDSELSSQMFNKRSKVPTC